MGSALVESCDVCGRIVSDVLRDRDEQSVRSIGYGYLKAKRIEWRFGPWPRFWHREDHGWEIVCDPCIDLIREAARAGNSQATPLDTKGAERLGSAP